MQAVVDGVGEFGADGQRDPAPAAHETAEEREGGEVLLGTAAEAEGGEVQIGDDGNAADVFRQGLVAQQPAAALGTGVIPDEVLVKDGEIGG